MTADASALRRLERRIRRRMDLRRGIGRAWQSVPAALQIVVAATAGYAIAHYGIGHQVPLLAVTITITTLGFTRDARPRRVLESVIGILTGVVVSEALGLVIGRGLWQLAVVLFVALVIARAVSGSPPFAVSAGAQSAIALLLPFPAGGPFGRSLDALIGGALALVVTALIPRDPRGAARRDGRTLFSVLAESTDSIAGALADADPAAGELALARLRRTQPLIDDWNGSLDTAIAVARISPWLRRHLAELRAQTRFRRGGDLAARSLRLVARRVEFLVRDGRTRPELAELLARFATALRLLQAEAADRELAGASRTLLTELAGKLAPASVIEDATVSESTVIVMLRPLVVDLLEAAGMAADAARDLLPPLPA